MLLWDPSWAERSWLVGYACLIPTLALLQVAFMEGKGWQLPLRSMSFIFLSAAQFCKQHGYSLAEFESAEWEQQWRASERAVRYGLDQPAQSSAAQMLARRDKARKASVAARRERRAAAEES